MAIKKHLYEILCVESDASVETITRSYRKLALEYHPDRNPSGAEKFKQINNAYATLSDDQKRRLYDATGITSDQGNANEENGLDANGRPTQQHSSELEAELHMFFATYANSSEEEEDVRRNYTQCDGNFRTMMIERLIFDNGKLNEVERLHVVVLKLIKEGKLTETETWKRTTSPKSLRKIRTALERERVEAEAALAEMELQSNCQENASANNVDDSKDKNINANKCVSLQTMIQQRQKASWANMLSNLEDKYVTKDKKRKREAMSEDVNSDDDKENKIKHASKMAKAEEKAKKKTKSTNVGGKNMINNVKKDNIKHKSKNKASKMSEEKEAM